MSPYLAGGLMIGFVIWSGSMFVGGYRYEKAECTVADDTHDLAQDANTIGAYKGVAATVQNQQTISQGVANAYENGIIGINGMYNALSVPGTSSPALNGMPPATPAPSGANAASCAKLTLKYKLSPRQCDVVAERLVGLQSFERGQRAAQK